MMRSIKYIILFVILAALILFGYQKIIRLIYPLKYSSIVEKYADEYNVDPSLVYSVINCESSFNPDARSKIGAIGLMQITPDTFDWAQTKCKPNQDLSSDSLTDPETNIKFGTLLLSLHLKEFSDMKTALAAYHAGRSKVNSWLNNSNYSRDGKRLDKIPFDDTKKYVERVIKTQKTYNNLYKEELKNAG